MRITEKTETRLVLASGSWLFVPGILLIGAGALFAVLFVAAASDSDPAFVAPISLVVIVGLWVFANAVLVWERCVFDKGIGRITISRRRLFSRRVEVMPMSAFQDARAQQLQKLRGTRPYRIVLDFDLDREGKGVPIHWTVTEKGEEKTLPMRASAVPLTHNSWTLSEAGAKALAAEIDVWMLRGAGV